MLGYWPRESGRPSSVHHSGQPARLPGWRRRRCLLHPPRQRCWSPGLWSPCAATLSLAPCQRERRRQGEGQDRDYIEEVGREIWPKLKETEYKQRGTQRLFQTTATIYWFTLCMIPTYWVHSVLTAASSFLGSLQSFFCRYFKVSDLIEHLQFDSYVYYLWLYFPLCMAMS